MAPGEDPYVVGRYALNFVRGLQDVPGHERDAADPMSRRLKTSALLQVRRTRFKFDARVQERAMVETFQRPFEMCVRHGDVSRGGGLGPRQVSRPCYSRSTCAGGATSEASEPSFDGRPLCILSPDGHAPC